MEKIKEEELNKISGGGYALAVCACLVGFFTFIIGFADGYVNKKVCNK